MQETEARNGAEERDAPVELAARTTSIRERIFAADDSRTELVPIEEWGVTIEVRSMTGEERSQTLKKYFDADTGELDLERLTPEIIIATSFDPSDGSRVFQPSDVEALNKKSAGALERLGQVALRLSGLDRRSREASGKAS